jgi:preprotein translocase subunit SecG
MYTLIIVFYISLLGIIGMILYKRHEVKTGKPTMVSRLGRGSDHTFQSVFGAAKKSLSYLNRHTFIALAHWIAFHILVRIRTFYVELKHRFISHPQGKKMIDAVRGRGEVKDHGASFYLRRISPDERK